MYKVFIIDDEPLARDELKYLLSQFSEIEILGESEDLQQILVDNLIDEIDCLFLDIELSNQNGIELAKELLQREEKPLIVFATAYDDYAIDAFNMNAFDYILKPFEKQRIEQTIVKLMTMTKKSERKEPAVKEKIKQMGKIAVSNEDRVALIKLQDVLYFTSEESKTKVITENKSYSSAESLITLEKKLGPNFIRVHRAFLINLEHLQELESWGTSKYNVILQGGHVVPVSRMYVKEIRKIFEM
ncbi:LytTR family DNA-binding domain-containing protein [Metasolibacillus meyeri]|uniref:LytTR family DNA-binding domain-containing protein n=1 Tax=Metasolibacillus meyeri TaxID=1071052 RepID=A0AAW9NNF5_9BACL|nr:LytTR family DNA-binding domain-containing protein [Metasolibacillus meyeri]MEC1178041.1 LytTR family DNA-binding domain-containing protein [Metasolibacillus meyeri]